MSILVRNLPKSFTQENLEDLFFEFGTIASCDLVMDEATNLSKGFGFVEMSSGAEEAIAALNDAEVDGRKLVVNESKPK